jgi:hypothetical protein
MLNRLQPVYPQQPTQLPANEMPSAGKAGDGRFDWSGTCNSVQAMLVQPCSRGLEKIEYRLVKAKPNKLLPMMAKTS